MTPRDLDLSADWSQDACKSCNGDGRAARLTDVNPTMHQVLPPHHRAAMVKCQSCSGTGQAAK